MSADSGKPGNDRADCDAAEKSMYEHFYRLTGRLTVGKLSGKAFGQSL
jgi:hypothetical protein